MTRASEALGRAPDGVPATRAGRPERVPATRAGIPRREAKRSDRRETAWLGRGAPRVKPRG
eukprot:8920784-Pyramimonas_sp.AAC.1